jgi:hypothetical protein
MVASLALATACAHVVKQDKATGPDGTVDGAEPIALEQDEAKLTGKVDGIVTYPGGDRIDWKLIDLPAEQKGSLALKMSWRTPRPGLNVEFDVFDETRRPVNVKPTRLRRVREATIADAHGKYYVRIYAPKRGDAGAYELLASFQPAVAPVKTGPIDMTKYPVPDPPKIADIPAGPPPPAPPTPCVIHDPLNPLCKNMCAQGAPPTWSGCIAPPPPCTVHDAANPNCASKCALNAPPNHPPCMKAMVKRLQTVAQVGTEVEVTVSVGAKQGIDSSWRVRLLSGDSKNPLPNGTGRISSVDETKIKVRFSGITTDIATQNPRVELLPPKP